MTDKVIDLHTGQPPKEAEPIPASFYENLPLECALLAKRFPESVWSVYKDETGVFVGMLRAGWTAVKR